MFFRAWTREQAQELGLAGWVRNCADGSVEAHLEGEESAIAQMIERLWRGSPAARVEDVQVAEAAPESQGRFEVRH